MQKKPAIKTKSKIALLTMLPSNMYSSLSQDDKQVWGKLSAEGRAMIIKMISATNEPSSEERISSSHERIEINKHEESSTLPTINERKISPGQLELQRRLAQAQLLRAPTQDHSNDTS